MVAGMFGVVILLITTTGLFWPGWFARPVGLVVGIAMIAAAATAAFVLLRRSAAWNQLRIANADDQRDLPAVVGTARALHRARNGILRRRLPAQVVPIRSSAGPWADGDVLLVHARPDGVALRDGDDVIVRYFTPRGPYLLVRPTDGAAFAAERSTLGAW
jgi:hypothetical protein